MVCVTLVNTQTHTCRQLLTDSTIASVASQRLVLDLGLTAGPFTLLPDIYILRN